MDSLKQHPHFAYGKKICKELQAKGFIAWMAGGCVRDGLLDREPKDIDVATSAHPQQVEELFPKTLAVGKQFGVIVVIEEGAQIEVASFRKDGNYSDGRHPDDIEFSSPEEDAARRDFTINALYFDPISEQIHDFVDGRNDLASRLIRCVGDPALRFDEDKLRMLRAVRFVAELGFDLDLPSLNEIKRRPKDIQAVSVERIFEELNKITQSRFRVRGWNLLVATGLVREVLPESNDNPEIQEQVAWILGMADDLSPMAVWSLWVYFDSLDRRIPLGTIESVVQSRRRRAEALCQRLKTSKDFQKSLVFVGESEARVWNPLSVPDLCRIAANENVKDLISLIDGFFHLTGKTPAQMRDLRVLVEEEYELPEPLLTGQNLKDLGIEPGPEMGVILHEAYDLQLEGRLSSLESAQKWATEKKLKSKT